MSYAVLNTAGWTLDRLAPYMSDVLREMGRLAKRFPKDVTTEALFGELLTGSKVLWLILDDGNLVSIAMSKVCTVDATGTRIAKLCDLAGRDVQSYAAPLCAALEQWADENNCSVLQIDGRSGWAPLLSQFGYREFARLYRKGER